TTGGVHINTMTGYRQQKPRIGLTKCPDLVDHYSGMQLLPCFELCELTLVQRDPAHSLARCTSLESWNESHEPLPFG
ncbi:hypothetical protein, partial [Aeromonas hydrophila]|uniref:hypothetical protein n=1 Tax=Aeromonas hydrophila TaxID=644 RepID=UPI003EC5119F